MYRMRNKHLWEDDEGFAQPTMPEMLARKQKCDEHKTETITQKVCQTIEKDMMPMNMIKVDGLLDEINWTKLQITIQTTVVHCIERHETVKQELTHSFPCLKN